MSEARGANNAGDAIAYHLRRMIAAFSGAIPAAGDRSELSVRDRSAESDHELSAVTGITLLTRRILLPAVPYLSGPLYGEKIVGLEVPSERPRIARRERPTGSEELRLSQEKADLLALFLEHAVLRRSKDFRNCFSFAAVMSGQEEALRPDEKQHSFRRGGADGAVVTPDELRSGELYLMYPIRQYPGGRPNHAVMGVSRADHCLGVGGDVHNFLVIMPNEQALAIYRSDFFVHQPDGIAMV
jgi:hypothetical protein